MTTDSVQAAPSRSPTVSVCEPCRELIELGIFSGRNAMALWQDLVDQHGFSGSYDGIKHFVPKLWGT